jgi:hypothetical protein
MRALSGNAGQAWLEQGSAAASFSPICFFSVFFPPTICHSGHKPASHVNEAPQVAALGGYTQGQSPFSIQKRGFV